jgi:hypothetical protein
VCVCCVCVCVCVRAHTWSEAFVARVLKSRDAKARGMNSYRTHRMMVRPSAYFSGCLIWSQEIAQGWQNISVVFLNHYRQMWCLEGDHTR